MKRNIITWFSIMLSLIIGFVTYQIRAPSVLADTPSTNLIKNSDTFSSASWNTWFAPQGDLGLSHDIEPDSDGDNAWHVSGTATADGTIGLYDAGNMHIQPSPGVLSVYVKGTIGTKTTLRRLAHESTSNQNEYDNLSDLKTDRYIRFYNQYINNSDSTTSGYSADTFYLYIKKGDVLDLWVKHMKLEAGSTMGFDQTTIASGTDGTSPWTLDNNGVLSFQAGTLSKSDTQNILSTYEDNITSITTANAGGKVYTPEDASFLFKAPEVTTALQTDMNNNTYADFESAVLTSKTKITSMDLSNLDTSKTTNMSGMFVYQINLKTITGATNLVTSAGTVLNGMFYYDTALQSIDVSSWDMSNVNISQKLFANDISLKSLDVSKWNVTNLRYADCTFQNMSSITSLDVSKWNTASLEQSRWMFGGMENLTNLDVSNWNMSHVVTMRKMFINTALSKLDLSKWKTPLNTSLENTFNGMPKLTSLNVSNLDVSNVTDFTGAFLNDSALTTLDISKWNTKSATLMPSMFQGMTKLASLDVSNLNMSNVTDMNLMFADDSSLTALNVTKWAVGNVKNFYGVFNHDSKITSLAVENWDTHSATNFSWLFAGSGISSLDLSKWNVSNVTVFAGIFSQLHNLTSVDLSNWNTTKGTDFRWAFYQNPVLTNINLSGWTIKSHTSQNYMFQDDTLLSALTLGPNVVLNSDSDLPDIKWVNQKDLSMYYSSAANAEAGTSNRTTDIILVPYKAPVLSDNGNKLSFTVKSGTDTSSVALSSDAVLSNIGYVGNDSNKPAITITLSSLTNGTHSYDFSLLNPWNQTLLPSTLHGTVSLSDTNTTRNTDTKSFNYNPNVTAVLTNLKYGYIGTYQAKITYTLNDGH